MSGNLECRAQGLLAGSAEEAFEHLLVMLDSEKIGPAVRVVDREDSGQEVFMKLRVAGVELFFWGELLDSIWPGAYIRIGLTVNGEEV